MTTHETAAQDREYRESVDHLRKDIRQLLVLGDVSSPHAALHIPIMVHEVSPGFPEHDGRHHTQEQEVRHQDPHDPPLRHPPEGVPQQVGPGHAQQGHTEDGHGGAHLVHHYPAVAEEPAAEHAGRAAGVVGEGGGERAQAQQDVHSRYEDVDDGGGGLLGLPTEVVE